MLFAIVFGFVFMLIFITGLGWLAAKIGNANPEIKDVAKKAAATTATQLIDRYLK